MAKIHLTADRVTRLLKGAVLEIDGRKVGGGPGRFRDTEVRGLLLCVAESKRKRRDDAKASTATITPVSLTGNWALRYQLHGRTHDMGLGSTEDFKLAAARERARAVRLKLADGIDPLEERRAAEAEAKAKAAKTVTFKQAATQFFNKQEKAWRSARSRQQFLVTMEEYVYPVLGALSVDAVTKDLVLRCIEPLWLTKTVTMSRVRSRIESVLSYAAARGLRSPREENPAAWSHLKFLLAPPGKVVRVKHHPALPYPQMFDFLTELRKREHIAAKALEFMILTATRTGDIVGSGSEAKPPMLWSHVDLEARVWTVPSTKTETELRVPLSDRAVAILRALPRERGNERVFIRPPGSGLTNLAMPEVVRRINAERQRRGLPRFTDPKRNNRDVVPHGFRSSFRDWAGECTAFPNPIIELCLAHKVSSAVEASYLRSDLIDKRARLMQSWSDFCASPAVEEGAVIPLRATT